MFMDRRTDGRTDGPQAHRYIPRTYRSGDKKSEGGDYVYVAKYMGGIMSTYTKIGRGDY